jgi:hypothetical protein
MARLGEPEKSSSSKTFIGVLIILIALGALGAIGFLSFRLSSEPGLTAELCPADGPVEHLAILLDTTDPLTLTHLQRTRQIVESKIDAALVGTRVSFSTVNPDSDIRQSAFFSICKPPSGDDASRLTENPRMVQEKYEKEFLDPVDDALDDLLTIPEAPSSPIMEGLQEFASRIPEFTTTDRPRELVIMSDLMQHSDAFSFYRGGNWKSFSDANGPERFGFTFKNADITVLRIPRLVEMAAVVDDFWVRYLMIQGFDDTNIISIGDL